MSSAPGRIDESRRSRAQHPVCEMRAAAEKAEAVMAAAFASLAERLDALAAERARPWWRRLTR